jgi:signal transduction histidine kinase
MVLFYKKHPQMRIFEALSFIFCITFLVSVGLIFILKKQVKYLKKENVELQNFQTQKSQYLKKIPHEIRTPIGVIKGYSDFLLRGEFGELRETQKDPIRRIYKNAESLLHLMNEIQKKAR